MLTFESTHEYYIGPDPDILYCEEHGTLIITQDHQDRLLITGINKETMLKFATKFYQNDLEKTIKEYNDKDADKVESAGIV